MFWAERFLRWFCKEEHLDVLLGDLYETYDMRRQTQREWQARLWFILEVFDLFRPFAWKRISSIHLDYHRDMLKHYFTIGWRSLWRHRSFSFLNIFGLALGLACCLLMVLYVQHELSFDRFHKDHERIYRVWTEFTSANDKIKVAVTPNIVSPLLQRAFPEQVKAGVRLEYRSPVVRRESKMFREEGMLFADSSFFDVFSFELIKGDPKQVLTEPRSLVLTRSTANRYFGTQDPINEVLLLGSKKTPFKVTGVMADPPSNSHLDFTILAPFHSIGGIAKEEQFGSANYLTYLKLDRAASGAVIEAKLPDLVKEHGGEEVAQFIDFYLQPLTEVYLSSTHLENYGYGKVGNMAYIYLFSTLAVLILLIAVINYVNLTTARSVDRAREVGLRKVIGARRQQLVQQFIGETVLVALISLVLGLIIMRLALPGFEQLVDREIRLNVLGAGEVAMLLVGGAISLGILAGCYPALVLSGFRPVSVLQGSFATSSRGSLLRKGLVVFQFSISVILIAGALIIEQQLGFIRNKKLGYDKSRVLVINVVGQQDSSLNVLRAALANDPAVSGTTTSTEPPHQINGGYDLRGVGDPDNDVMVTATMIDDQFVPVMGMKLVAGRNYTPQQVQQRPEDGNYAFIINEQTAKLLGKTPEEAIGQPLNLHGREGTIQGVVEDFHFASLHQEIGPLVFFNDSWRSNLLVRMTPGPTGENLSRVRKVWEQVLPSDPFDYHFLDDSFDALYRSEEQASNFAVSFAGLAIFIAILGLLGLAAYTMVQRRKEIGIRKVLGASVGEIITLLSREFTILVLIAFLIGTGVCAGLMQRWLSDFAYHIDLSWEVFAITGILALLMAWGVVSVLAYRTANRNPVEALRAE